MVFYHYNQLGQQQIAKMAAIILEIIDHSIIQINVSRIHKMHQTLSFKSGVVLLSDFEAKEKTNGSGGASGLLFWHGAQNVTIGAVSAAVEGGTGPAGEDVVRYTSSNTWSRHNALRSCYFIAINALAEMLGLLDW